MKKIFIFKINILDHHTKNIKKINIKLHIYKYFNFLKIITMIVIKTSNDVK